MFRGETSTSVVGRPLPTVAGEQSMETVVAEPVLIVLVAVCSRGLVRLAEVLAYWIALRSRVELARIAAATLLGAEVAEQNRRHDSGQFRSQRPHGESHG